MPASWTLSLVDVNGSPLTDNLMANASNVSVTVPEWGPVMFQCDLPLTSEEAAVVGSDTEADYYIKAYRTPSGGTVYDRTLRFYGSVWVDECVGQDGEDRLAVTALDPMALLAKRYTLAQFSPSDLGTLLVSMIDTTNSTDGETGISTSSSRVTASSTIDLDARTNRPTILSMADQFAGMLDGCKSWVQPIELASGKICEFYAAPDRGVSNTGVVFGYGPDTEANCSSMSRSRDKAKIENDARGYTDSLTSTKTNETSVAALRRLVGYTSFTGETSQTVLDARTQGRLDDRSTKTRVAEYRCTPAQVDNIPALWDDFDVGDTVTLDFRKGVEWQATPRVVQVKLGIADGSRVERLEAVDFRGAVAS